MSPGFKRDYLLVVLLTFLVAPGWSADEIAASYQKGEQALKQNDLKTAEKAFQDVLRLAPNDVGAHVNLGVIYMRKKAWQKALAELETGEKLAPRIAGIRLNIGLAYFRQGDYAKAIPAFESVLRDDPGSTQARQLLGLCYFFELRYAEAASTLEILWTARNEDLSYLYVLTVASGNAGRHDLEEKAMQRLLEVGKDSAEFHLFLGKAYLSREDDDRAQQELHRAEKADPRLPFVHYNLGLVYKRKREFEQAKQEFLKDREIEPDVPYNYDELGTVTAAMGDHAEAARYFQEAVKRDSRLGTSWYGLAKIYKQEKKYSAALEALSTAESIDPKSASVHYLKAQVLSAMNRKPEAERELAVVRRLEKETADSLEQKISGSKYQDPQLLDEK